MPQPELGLGVGVRVLSSLVRSSGDFLSDLLSLSGDPNKEFLARAPDLVSGTPSGKKNLPGLPPCSAFWSKACWARYIPLDRAQLSCIVCFSTCLPDSSCSSN
eukprot:872676-Amorphochlora_amoeboformis.AAC.1